MCEAPVERSGTFLYLMTIKCNNKVYTSRDGLLLVYSRLLRRLGSYELSDNKAWELDSDKRWHYHFIIALAREPYYKKFQVPNYTIHFQKFHIDDYFKVVTYLRKIDQRDEHLEQLDIESQIYYSQNPFVDD